MKKVAVTILAFAVLFAFILPVSSALELETDESFYKRFENDNITLNVYNWGEYISDGSDDSLDVIREFEKLTGISVHYTTFASNEDMYAKIKNGGAQYDVIIPSDYMVGKMANEDMLEKLDYDNIPNFALVNDKYKSLEYDPNNEYSVPYMWGTVGIVYNTTMVDDEIDSWNALWDTKYLGSILMFNNPRDAFGISELRLGYSLNTTDEEELAEAGLERKPKRVWCEF